MHRRHSGKPPGLWQVVNQIGGERVFFGNLLWKTRGAWICWSATGWLAKGNQRAYLQTGDTVDSWKVIIVEEENSSPCYSV